MPPTIFFAASKSVAVIIGSSTLSISLGSGQRGWIIDFNNDPVCLRNLVTDAGGGRDQLEIKLTLQPFLNDVHVQQAEEPAAEPEAQCLRTFRVEEERRVVQAQFFQSFAKLRVRMRVNRVESRKNHGLDFFESGQCFERGMRVIGDGVANLGVGDVLDVGNEKAGVACAQFADVDRLWGEHAEGFNVESPSVGHQFDFLPLRIVPSKIRTITMTPR